MLFADKGPQMNANKRKYFLATEFTENTEVSIVCRSDFSRELELFATKVAPANTCNCLCVLCASVASLL